MPSRPNYSGSEAKLVIAIDIGTTYSGASYTFLKPGSVPHIFDVKGFKGQEDRESNTKVPSILLYTKEGKLVACGAETRTATKRFGPQSHIRTEWFKLAMRPASMRIDTPPITLPPGRTLVEVFGDFLRYMYDCVHADIVKSHAGGEQIWVSLHDSAHFILSHPNGWGSLQQSRMRQAAIEGGLIPNTSEGKERVEFVSEGEASFHWCVEETVAEKALKAGTKIVVADLGGGTIDVSSFRVVDPKPLRLQETPLLPDCVVAGSITVTDRFVKAIRARLQETPYGDQDSMETLREEFDSETKCLFRDEADKSLYIRIGGRRDHHEDSLCKIEYGILEVQRNEVERAFEPSIEATVQAIKKHVEGQQNVYIFLVGGFAASPWVLSETNRRLKEMGITCAVTRADSNTAKAVAHGGVAFYLDRYITERIMRFTYGLFLAQPYDPSDPEHKKRAHKLQTDPTSGEVSVPGGFHPLVQKGQLVKVDSVYKQNVTTVEGFQKPEIHSWEEHLVRYSGSIEDIAFVDMDPSAFDVIGWFECDMPATAMTRQRGKHGTYWQPEWDVVITLGTVEIKCHVEWEENGVKKRWAITEFVGVDLG